MSASPEDPPKPDGAAPDADAFWRRWWVLLYQQVLRLTRNDEALARDITQQVVMRFLRRGVTHLASPLAAFVTTAQRLFIDHCRRSGRHVSLGELSADNSAEDTGHATPPQSATDETPEDIAIRESDVEQLHAALAQLPPHERAAVTAWALGLTEAEALAALQVSRSTYYDHRNRGVERLRILLCSPHSTED